jgi:predicted RecB family endonuclease
MRFWREYPTSQKDKQDAEIDAVAVVDGIVYAVEAKSSSRIDDKEINQLVMVAERIRPDIMLVASMEAENSDWRHAMTQLQKELPACTMLNTRHFNETALDRLPWLPA